MTLLLFTAGFALSALLGVYLPGTAWFLPAGLVCLTLGTALLPRLRRPCLVVLGAAAALLWLHAYGQLFLAPAHAMENRTLRLEATVADWPVETDYGVRFTVRAGEAGGRKVKATFFGDETLASLRPGDRLSCVARCTPAGRTGEEGLYYSSKGILLQCKGYGEIKIHRAQTLPWRYAPALLAGWAREQIDRLYPAKQAGFLHALLTGDKSSLDEADQDHFKRVGLSHVVVISGLHLSFLAGFLTLFLKPKGPARLLLLLAILTAFTLSTGSAPGTVRAAVLTGLTLTGQCIRRETHAMTSLSAGLLLLLLLNPYAAANAGLQFSFLSTVGIFIFGQPWSAAWLKRLPKFWQKWAKPLVGTAAVSLGTMLFTVPLSALYFGQFSLIAPLSNLLTAWAVSLAFLGGMLSVAAGAVFLPLGQVLAAGVSLPVRFFFWYSETASRLTLAAVGTTSVYFALWVALVYGTVCLCLFLPGRRSRPLVPLCVCAAGLFLAAFLNTQSLRRWDMNVIVLDVGQGQSIFLNSGSAWALVDCGGSDHPGDSAATYLQTMGRSSLDLLVLTHFDTDHAAGVPALMGRIRVKHLAIPDFDPDSPLRQEIEALAAAQSVPVHYITTTHRTDFGWGELWLYAPVGGKTSNENCVAVLGRSGDWETLITGDLPQAAEEQLLQREDLPDLEVLIAGHHGSKHSTGEALLSALRPETAVISVGRNHFGHPAQEVLDRLSDAGAQVYRTDQDGTIILSPKGQQEAD